MKRHLACFLFLALASGIAYSQTAQRHFVIEILNGETGKPLHGIFFGPALNISVFFAADSFAAPSTPPEQHTNFYGRKTIVIGNVQDRKMKVWLDFIKRDCRFADPATALGYSYDGSTLTLLPQYSLAEIIDHGVVGQNFCGAPRGQSKPGVLVLYAMPLSFKELWDE